MPFGSFDERNESMIRVFHLIKSLGRGGAETLLSQGLASGDREHFEYGYGYFLPWKDQLVGELESQGAQVTCFSARTAAGCFSQLPALVQFLRRWRPDVLHCHLPVASIVGRLAGQILGVPVVSSEHNLLQRYHAATRAATLATWRLQSRVIAVSGEVEQSIHKHGQTKVPVRVVRNGVDVERFKRNPEAGRALREELGIPEDAPVAGTVAVFRTQKRLDEWLLVARRVLDQNDAAYFLLVGDGPEAGNVDRVRRELGLEGRVIRCGLQSDVRAYLSAMDVYLMTSKFEGLPIAMLEAMAAGLPIVATGVGGIPEVVRNGEEGFLTSADQALALANPLIRLFASPDETKRLGASAQERVRAEFGMGRMQGELESIYREVVVGD